MKRSWLAYKLAGRNGMFRGDLAWRINRLKSAMGIERSNFPELEGINDEKSEEESDGEWNVNFETNEGMSELTDEWSEEDKQLQREEKAEEDDWWFS